MPIYDYRCSKCGGIFEKLILPPITRVVCPECNSTRVEQLVSAPALHNTTAGNDVLSREYRNYNERWAQNAYQPKAKPRRKSR